VDVPVQNLQWGVRFISGRWTKSNRISESSRRKNPKRIYKTLWKDGEDSEESHSGRFTVKINEAIAILRVCHGLTVFAHKSGSDIYIFRTCPAYHNNSVVGMYSHDILDYLNGKLEESSYHFLSRAQLVGEMTSYKSDKWEILNRETLESRTASDYIVSQ
jgi:hypothetical protein